MMARSLKNSPVFICGHPKSGTTLLAQMFNNLADTKLDIELHFASHMLEMMARTLSKRDEFSLSELDPLTTRYQELLRDDHQAYFGLCKTMFQDMHSGFPHLRWGNNCKPTIDFVPLVKRMFPESRIIFMLRDPRDVWASTKHSTWPGQNSLPHFLRRYRTVYDMSLTDQTMTLLFRDLVSNPQSAFSLIDETFHRDHMKGIGRVMQYRTLPRDELFPEHITVEDKLFLRNDRYKNELLFDERNVIEREFSDVLHKHSF